MITYPLNNIDYTAEDAELFHCTRTSGIWAEDSFPISVTGADNNVTIGTGIAWINNEEFSGKVAALKSAEMLDLGIADGVYPRIDVIAIQYSANNNATDVVIKKGTPATNPVRPSIVRTGAIYELYLASVYRPAGATVITASNITDLRMDTTVCGLMADSVTKIDMDAIRAQLIGLVEELEEAIQNIEVGEIVPIEKGGTNASTAVDARSNLGLGAVATEDILPIEKGGHGGNNATDARTNLGLGNVATEDVLPISKGGTGKTNATDARMNLGIYREFVNGTLWTSENVASGSDAAIIVIPFLRLCFMRAYIVPKRVFAANEQYGVITVPEAYRPAYAHALNIHVGGRVLAKSRVVGESGYVYVTTNVETNYEMYITGMWYY